MNPFLSEYTTPHGVPPFDQVQFEHFEPAFAAGFAEQTAEYDAIEQNPESPTFENTILALERSGGVLHRVARVFYSLMGTDSTPEMSALAKDIGAQMAAHRNRLYLSQAMYERLHALQSDPNPDWTGEQARLVEEYHRHFARSGVQLEDDKRHRLQELDEQLATLSSQYRDNMLAETNNATVHLTELNALDGLSDAIKTSAKQLAEENGLEGWLFKPNRVTLYPFLTQSNNRMARQKIYTAYVTRGRRGNAEDNTELAQTMSTLRLEKAQILGSPNYAAHILQDSMAKTPEAVLSFLDQSSA